MKKNYSTIFISLIQIVFAFEISAQTIIVKETFTNGTTSNINVPGLAPDVTNLPAQTWVAGAGWNWATPHKGSTSQGIYSNACDMGENGEVLGISIASNGSYTKPTQIRLSADVEIHGVTTAGGVALGFYSVMPALDKGDQTVFVLPHFTGLKLTQDGALTLYEDGVAKNAIAGPAIVLATFYTLAYDVNTSTGTISNVSLQGSTSTYNFTSTAFTDAATTYAAYAVNGGANGRGAMDNFIVSRISDTTTGLESSVAGMSEVYPNPASDKIYFAGNIKDATIFTLEGKQLLTVHNQSALNVSSLSKGLYIISTTDNSGVQKATKIDIR